VKPVHVNKAICYLVGTWGCLSFLCLKSSCSWRD